MALAVLYSGIEHLKTYCRIIRAQIPIPSRRLWQEAGMLVRFTLDDNARRFFILSIVASARRLGALVAGPCVPKSHPESY
jgi:hypothetical protein